MMSEIQIHAYQNGWPDIFVDQGYTINHKNYHGMLPTTINNILLEKVKVRHIDSCKILLKLLKLLSLIKEIILTTLTMTSFHGLDPSIKTEPMSRFNVIWCD